MAKRPTEIATLPVLVFTVGSYLTDHGVSDPVAAIIALAVGMGPLAVSALVDKLTSRRTPR